MRWVRLDRGFGAAAGHPTATAGFAVAPARKQFNERSAGVLNRIQFPSDVIALVVLWRVRYTFSLLLARKPAAPTRRYAGQADAGHFEVVLRLVV